jgi:hypothetical protein
MMLTRMPSAQAAFNVGLRHPCRSLVRASRGMFHSDTASGCNTVGAVTGQGQACLTCNAGGGGDVGDTDH